MTALPVEPTWSHTKHGFTHRFLREISVAVAYLILLLILFIVEIFDALAGQRGMIGDHQKATGL